MYRKTQILNLERKCALPAYISVKHRESEYMLIGIPRKDCINISAKLKNYKFHLVS
jgi:hypothetical protein